MKKCSIKINNKQIVVHVDWCLMMIILMTEITEVHVVEPLVWTFWKLNDNLLTDIQITWKITDTKCFQFSEEAKNMHYDKFYKK